MGVCFDLVCKTCKKRLDIGKHWCICSAWTGTVGGDCEHKDQCFLHDTIAWMRRHWGHECEVRSDHDDGDADYLNLEEEDVRRPPAQT